VFAETLPGNERRDTLYRAVASHRQHGDNISLLSIFQNEESRLLYITMEYASRRWFHKAWNCIIFSFRNVAEIYFFYILTTFLTDKAGVGKRRL
jgi:hypothetical protein